MVAWIEMVVMGRERTEHIRDMFWRTCWIDWILNVRTESHGTHLNLWLAGGLLFWCFCSLKGHTYFHFFPVLRYYKQNGLQMYLT